MDSDEDTLTDLEAKEEPLTYSEDVTTKVIGDFGKWQLKISVLMSLIKLSNSWYQLNIIFMAPPQDFWCVKPKSFERYTDEEWRRICSPKVEEHPCLIFDPDILIISPQMDRTYIQLVPCTDFVYDTSVFNRTMTSDFDLVCSKHWKVHITQCVMMWGVLLGGVIFGTLADKYGRRTPLMAALLIQCICSFIAVALPSYAVFLFNWFILALASGGTTIISFVLCMEAVSGKWRMIIPILYQLPFGLGSAVMSGLAYWLRDWRQLEFALATLSSVYVFYWFCVPESPRWLIANGQTDKAIEILKEASIENNRPWTTRDLKALLPKHTQQKKALGCKDLMKSKTIRLTSFLLSINWFCTGCAFYSFSQYLGGIGSNIFLTVAVTGIISVPGPIVCVFVIMRMGRKHTIWIFQIMTGLCFVAILAIPRDRFKDDWPRLVAAGIGFAGMAASVPTLYLYSGELYPTLGRNVGVGTVTIFARVGSMISPIIVALDTFMMDLPIILLAVTSFLQVFLLVPLPETRGAPLPDTMEQVEEFRNKSQRKDRRDMKAGKYRLKRGL